MADWGYELMEVLDVLESIDHLLVLANGPNNHSAGISVVAEARATHESRLKSSCQWTSQKLEKLCLRSSVILKTIPKVPIFVSFS